MSENPWLQAQEAGAPETPEAAAERERMLFELCPLPLWIYDVGLDRIIRANDAACTKYGYSHEEFTRLTLRDFQPNDAVGLATNPLGLSPLDVFVSGCWRHRCRDGSVIHVEVTANDMLFMGRRARFVCPNDVTQRLQAEAKLRERKAALRRAQDMARLTHHITGPDGVFESWADSLPRLLGIDETRMPITARDWLPWVHADDRERFRAALVEAGRRGAGCDIEYRLVRADGQTIHVREVLEPIHELDNSSRGRWFCTLQDVSAQKLAEEMVRRHAEELEARVAERTTQLQISNCELAFATAAAERANRSKSEFLSNMSHELRTPLNAILGFGQLLAMSGGGPGEEARRSGYVQHIVAGGRHLLTLINEILNLAQIEAGKVEVRVASVDLGPLLAECGAMVDPLAERRDIRMQFPPHCELHVSADRMRLKQVLLNLVSNAIKYNRPGGRVEVECEPVDAAVRIHVRDTGQGLGRAELDALFEAFNRLGQDTSSEEGSGVGLVVSKRLVELMGGRIMVASEPGVGSVFSVELPAAAPAACESDDSDQAWLAPAAAAEVRLRLQDQESSGQAATILCVDDDEASLRLLQQVLATLPAIELQAATHGRQGVEMALAGAPSLVIMDNNMPEMTGREALARLRADPRTAAIPVIFVSADAMPAEAAAGLAAGAMRYLTKPIDVVELLQAVGQALALARGTR